MPISPDRGSLLVIGPRPRSCIGSASGLSVCCHAVCPIPLIPGRCPKRRKKSDTDMRGPLANEVITAQRALLGIGWPLDRFCEGIAINGVSSSSDEVQGSVTSHRRSRRPTQVAGEHRGSGPGLPSTHGAEQMHVRCNRMAMSGYRGSRPPPGIQAQGRGEASNQKFPPHLRRVFTSSFSWA